MNGSRHLASIFLTLALAGWLAGCASVGAPVPPSLELPKPPTDLRAVRKGDHVYLFWTLSQQTTDRQNVRHPGPIRICRSLAAVMSACDTPVGNVAPGVGVIRIAAASKGPSKDRLEGNFVDTLPRDLEQQNPAGMVTYAVEALNLHSRSAGLSNQVQVPLLPTQPPPQNLEGQVTADGVVLTWDCETFPPEALGVDFVYRINRHSADTGAEVKLAAVKCPGQFEDRSIEWQKTYEYRITVVTEATSPKESQPCVASRDNGASGTTCGSILAVEGDDSAPLKVFTNDVFPPGVPTGLEAVFSAVGQALSVDLVWAPDTDADLAGYNVYRSEEGGQFSKINRDVVKAPAYRDPNVVAGRTYHYSVSAVDLRGNESARSNQATETIPRNF